MNRSTEYRKAYMALKVVEYRRKQRLKAVDYKGGACATCGVRGGGEIYVFRHDKGEKGDTIIGTCRNFEKGVKPFLDECTLLCANCCREVEEKETCAELAARWADLKRRKPRRGRPVTTKEAP